MMKHLVSLFLLLAMSLSVRADKPNIIMFLADDLGYNDLSYQGGKDIPTPAIDSIAQNGVSCLQAYTTAPVCAPSRAALFTGRYQQRFGFEDNPGPFRREPGIDVGMDLNEKTIADRLKALGYVTGMIGKLHDGKEEKFLPPNRGFDEFYGFNNGAQRYLNVDSSETPMLRGTQPEKHGPGYLTDTFGRESVAFIERHQSKPFFLFVSFNAPHGPLTAPASWLAKFASIENKDRRTYCAMVASMDENVGKVLNKLRDLDIEDNTLVYFLSDHGGVKGAAGKNHADNGILRAGKGTLFEGGVRTPLYVQWKNVLPKGATFKHPVSAIDLLPTSVAAAGGNIEQDWQLDGVNLLPYLLGEKTGRPHQTLFWRINLHWAIRHGDMKLVKDRGSDQPMLFNLARDPGEAADLAAIRKQRVSDLKAKFDAWAATVEKPRFGWWSGVGPRVED